MGDNDTRADECACMGNNNACASDLSYMGEKDSRTNACARVGKNNSRPVEYYRIRDKESHANANICVTNDDTADIGLPALTTAAHTPMHVSAWAMTVHVPR